MTGATENDDLLNYGDVVEHRMNTNVFGVVIGFQGSLVGIRLSPSLAVAWFHEWELRLDEPSGAAADNVIDFTKARELRANTPTKGVA